MKNVIILGSGRSGTSMLAGSLAKAGYFLGKNANYLGENKSNPKGFFEDFEVNTINEDILRLSLPVFPEKIRKRIFPSYTFYRARWLARLPLRTKIKTTSAIEKRIKKIVENEPFCLKDPRFSYTYPTWKKHFNRNTQFIVIYRNPAKTAASILRECKESAGLKDLKINQKIALQVWKSFYSHILNNYHNSSEKKDWFFLHFDQIFNPEIVFKLEEFLEVKMDTNFPEKKISRTGEIKGNYNSEIQTIYSKLNRLAEYNIT